MAMPTTTTTTTTTNTNTNTTIARMVRLTNFSLACPPVYGEQYGDPGAFKLVFIAGAPSRILPLARSASSNYWAAEDNTTILLPAKTKKVVVALHGKGFDNLGTVVLYQAGTLADLLISEQGVPPQHRSLCSETGPFCLSWQIEMCQYKYVFQGQDPNKPKDPQDLYRLSNMLKDCSMSWEAGKSASVALHTAIIAGKKALASAPTSLECISHLASIRFLRYQKFKFIFDLDGSIALQRRAVDLTPPDDASYGVALALLAEYLSARIMASNLKSDIEETLAITSERLATTQKNSDQYVSLEGSNVIALHWKFRITGDIEHLYAAMTMVFKSECHNSPSMDTKLRVRLGKAIDATLASSLDSLAASSSTQLIREFVACAQKSIAISSTPSGYHTLGASFLAAHKINGQSRRDLESALEALSISTRLLADEVNPDPQLLLNLSSSITSHVFLSRDLDMGHIAEARNLIIRALSRSKEEQDVHHNALVQLIENTCLRWTYDIGNSSGVFGDQMPHQAITGSPNHHMVEAEIEELTCRLLSIVPSHSPWLLQGQRAASMFYMARAASMGNHEELHIMVERVQKLQQAGPSSQDTTSSMRSILDFLHKVHIAVNASERYRKLVLQENRLAALDPQERTLKRLKCAQGWAGAYAGKDHEQSLEAYDVAIGLLATCGWLNSRALVRHHFTTDILALGKWGAAIENNTDLPLAAAAKAVECGYIGRALEWLEQGRRLVWDKIQPLRTPLGDLERSVPQLAQQMLLVWKFLEGSGNDLGGEIAAAEDLATRVRASREWEKLLNKARGFPGFGDLLLPSRCSTILQHLPESGPVVILNADQLRCDAIVLVRGRDLPLVVPLLDMTYSKAKAMQQRLNREIKPGMSRMAEAVREELEKELATEEEDEGQVVRGRGPELSRDDTMKHLLGEIWSSVVKPVLDALRFNTRSATPSTRIWWCPTGPFTFLPIHAAGAYGIGVSSECLADYAVSSYTPTVSALTARVKEKRMRKPGNSRLLLIGVPEAPGLVPIYGTTKEIQALRDLATVNCVDCLCLEGEEATTTRVMEKISQSSMVHFACHASQTGVADPIQSGFHLQDGRLSLSTIIEADLRDTSFAYLSACHSRNEEENPLKEDFYLAAGMLAAGFRGVVATMWAIQDAHAPRVAEDFYKDLLERGKEKMGGGIDEEDAAFALHHAIQELKKRLAEVDKSFLIWFPYVHYGI